MKRPLTLLGFAMLAFLFTGFTCSLKVAMYISAAVLIAAAVLVLFSKSAQRQTAVILCIAAFASTSAFSYNYFHVYKKAVIYTQADTSLSGTLAQAPQDSSAGIMFTLKNCVIGGIRTGYSVSIFSNTSFEAQPGDIINCKSVTLSESNGYSASEYTDISFGTYLSASIFDGDISVSAQDKPGLYYRTVRLRSQIIGKLSEYYDDDKVGILAALILGDTSLTDDEINTSFRLSGLSHLFAVSGLHLTLWSGLIYKLFGIYRKRQRLQSFAAIIFVLFFMTLTLFTPSVCRSGIMLIVVYAGNIVRKDSDNLNSLGLAITLLLCYNPFYAANPSFLLSVFATFAIIVLYSPLEKYLTDKCADISFKPLRKLTSFALKSIVLSLTVSVFLIPLSAYFFGYTSFVAPIANILCVYPAEIAMIIGVISYVVSLFLPPVAVFAAMINSFIIEYIINTTKFLSALPFALFSLNTPIVLPWFVCSAVLITAYFFFSKHKKRTFHVLVATLCALVLTTDIYYYQHNNDVSLDIYSSNESSFAVLTNGYEDKIYISLSEPGDCYSDIYTHYRKSKYPCCDMLLMLSCNNKSNADAASLINKLTAKTAVCPPCCAIAHSNDTQLFSVAAADFDVWHGIKLTYRYTNDMSILAISSDNDNILICSPDDVIPDEFKNYRLVFYGDSVENEKFITIR